MTGLFARWRQRANQPATAAPAPPCQVRFADGRAPLTVPHDGLLLATALQAGLPWPHNCQVGTCGACKTRVLSGRVQPMMDFALSPLTSAELKSGHVLACQSRVRGDLLVDLQLPPTAPAIVALGASIRQAAQPAPDVLQLQLQLDAPLDFLAGQHVQLSLDGFAPVRSYSICEAPQPGGLRALSFLIRRLPGGQFSEALFRHAAPGGRMRLQGPFGAPAPLAPGLPILGVAGGTGLAPLLSLVAHRLAAAPQSRCTLLLGLRRQSDDFATPLLAPLLQAHPGRVQVQLWLSDEPQGSAWTGPRGLVVDGLSAPLLQASGAAGALLCGNAAMVHTARERLLALGMAASAIHADAFAPSGGGAG